MRESRHVSRRSRKRTFAHTTATGGPSLNGSKRFPRRWRSIGSCTGLTAAKTSTVSPLSTKVAPDESTAGTASGEGQATSATSRTAGRPGATKSRPLTAAVTCCTHAFRLRHGTRHGRLAGVTVANSGKATQHSFWPSRWHSSAVAKLPGKLVIEPKSAEADTLGRRQASFQAGGAERSSSYSCHSHFTLITQRTWALHDDHRQNNA